MGSDRARISYNAKQRYRSVVMQQGRVTLEADWNEAQLIASEETRKEALDFVGPAGTPDNGYAISFPSGLPAFDFEIGEGIMYVGGERAVLPQSVQYSKQPDWLDKSIDPDWTPLPTAAPSGNEYIYLFLREQEVSAVEDSDLKDVALGGPDTAQRTRLIQHVERLATTGTDCASALKAAATAWAAKGFVFDPDNMRVEPSARMQVGFVPTGTATPCDPTAQGGYLGADNQLIRVQISSASPSSPSLLWGFDDASFLYRVTVLDPQTLQLQSAPIDAEHTPQGGQAVEVLMCATKLSNGEYVAAPDGQVFTLATSSYNADSMTLSLPSALNPAYGDGKAGDPAPPQVYLRVWQQQLPFTPGAAVTLGDTGVQVTLQTAASEPYRVGDYWMFAVRPGAPQQVYPERYLVKAQPPDGPREWICPLAVIQWPATGGIIIADCRNPFDNLTTLTRRNLGGCCAVNVKPSDLTGGKTLQTIVDQYSGSTPVNICLAPGDYALAAPLLLNSGNSRVHFEACAGGVTLSAAANSEVFLQGLVILNSATDVSFHGIQFLLPLVPLGATSIGSSGVAETAAVVYSIGIRSVNCTDLHIEDCGFEFRSAPNAALLAIGIFASGDCVGLTLENNRFELPASSTSGVGNTPVPVNSAATASLTVGFLQLPAVMSNDLRSDQLLKSGATAQVLSSELSDAVIRDNLFSGLSLCAFVYADCGLVEVESNVVRNCNWGFWFLTLPSLAYADNLADISVAAPYSAKASALQSGLFTAVGHPAIQFAAAKLRSFPLPDKVDLTKAIPVTVRKVATTLKDCSALQTAFDRSMPAASSDEAAAGQVKLNTVSGTIVEHPEAAEAVTGVAILNQNLNIIEKLTFTPDVTTSIPLGLHFNHNDVRTQVSGSATGLGLFLWDLGTNDQDAVSLTGNTFVGADSAAPVVLIAGPSRATCTGNIVLNEASGDLHPSLWLYPVSISNSATGLQVFTAAVTGNVFKGGSSLPIRNLTPVPPAPMNSWDFFNSET